MTLARIARNALVGSALWSLLSSRRRAAARQRRGRFLGATLLAAFGAGAGWAARRRVFGRASAEPVQSPAPRSTDPAPAARRTRPGAAAKPSGAVPQASVKKQRKRARQSRAEQREKAAQAAAHGGTVKLEMGQTEDLRVPLADLTKP